MAIDYFEQAERVAQTAEMRELSRSAIDQLSDETEQTKATLWFALGTGYDDNALLADDEIDFSSDQSDNLYQLTLYGNLQLLGTQKHGLQALALYQQETYAELTDFDSKYRWFGAQYAFPIGGLQNQLRYSAHQTVLGEDDFENNTTTSLISGVMLGATTQLRFKLDYESVDAEDDFAFLDGDRKAAALTLRHHKKRWSIGYKHETNDRNDLLTNNNEFFSFSPTKDKLELKFIWPLSNSFGTEFDTSKTQKTYPDPDTRLEGTNTQREDDRTNASLLFYYLFKGNWRLNLEFNHSENSSNFAEFNYARSTAFISLDKAFEFSW